MNIDIKMLLDKHLSGNPIYYKRSKVKKNWTWRSLHNNRVNKSLQHDSISTAKISLEIFLSMTLTDFTKHYRKRSSVHLVLWQGLFLSVSLRNLSYLYGEGNYVTQHIMVVWPTLLLGVIYSSSNSKCTKRKTLAD